MSEYPDGTPTETPRIAFVLEARPRDLGGFSVRRSLPSMRKKRVGPFVFVDHMGPFDASPGTTVSVRPHPHIELATVTYLFDGEIVHRDSLGNRQVIVPGDVNWMTAGRGIVHSERTDEAAVKRGQRMHGLQCWVGLPTKDEQCAPAFTHYASEVIPSVVVDGLEARVVIGTAYGTTSPVRVLSPTVFVDAKLSEATTFDPPVGYDEMATYVVEGSVTCDGAHFGAGTMLVFRDGERPELEAARGTRVVFVGGAPLDGERLLFWNFVSSSQDRIEQAKKDWQEENLERFPKVPGDEEERIPLPS